MILQAQAQGRSCLRQGLVIVILMNMQILAKTKVLFSRLWHVGEKSEEQPLWLLALQLGAECTTKLDSSVTHVVTNTKFTEKVKS